VTKFCVSNGKRGATEEADLKELYDGSKKSFITLILRLALTLELLLGRSLLLNITDLIG
jgi:hypothetical protein